MSITKLAETMVRREYSRKQKNLPDKFWNLPEYKPSYQNQMRFAAKLYRTYSEKAIWNVINRESWVYSLAVKKLANLIEIEENKIKINDNKPIVEKETDTSLPAFRIQKRENLLEE